MTTGERIHEAEMILDAFMSHKLDEHHVSVALNLLHISCNLGDNYHGRFDCTIDGCFINIEAKNIRVTK